MFCRECRQQRGSGRFCVRCGASLVTRPLIEVAHHLTLVRWLLEETHQWGDASATSWVRDRYARQERLLEEALLPAEPSAPPQPVAEPLVVEVPEPLGVEVPEPLIIEATEPMAVPATTFTMAQEVDPLVIASTLAPVADSAPASPPSVSASLTDSPTVDRPAPPPHGEPSSFWRHLKPVLHESVGWFLGAFLILSGALYLIADAWGDMTTSTRAITVFGLLEVWAVGFAAWAFALSRKDSTRGASAGLSRIAALIAPLSVLALGPATSSPLAWLGLAVGSGVAALLALQVGRALDEPNARTLSVAVAVATLLSGLAPVLPASAGWLVLVPAALAAYAFLTGPRATPGKTWTAVFAFSVPLLLVGVRLVAVGHAGPSATAGLVLSLALLSAVAPRLSTEAARSTTSLLSLVVLVLAFLASFFVAKPVCVLTCIFVVGSTYQLARTRSPWWLSGTWLAAFLAWQRVDQLVPEPVWAWWAQVKSALGYATTPMPASYASVMQALFIAVSALGAGLLLWRNRSHRGAHVWLRISVVAAGLAGLLSVLSFSNDPRPALVALPLLAVPMLGVGLLLRRTDALGSGTLLLAGLGLATLTQWPAEPVAAGIVLSMSALAWGVSALHPRAHRLARRWLATTSLGLGGLVVLVASVGGFFIPLFMATLAIGLSGRLLGSKVQTVSLFVLWAPLLRLETPWAPVVLGLLLALWARFGSRRARVLEPLAFSLAVGGSVWALVAATAIPSGLWCLVGVGALVALRRDGSRAWLDAVALPLLVAALIPWHARAGLWPDGSMWHTAVGTFVLAAAAGVRASQRGRHWQATWLAVLAVGVSALAAAVDEQWLLAALTLVVLTPALAAWFTVPLAAAVLVVWCGAWGWGLVALCVGCSLLAFAEESDWLWRRVLNQVGVSWAASLTSAALLVAAFMQDEVPREALVFFAATLPLLWARATRQPLVLFASLPLFFGAGPAWLMPLLAVAWGRLSDVRVLRAFITPSVAGPVERALRLALTVLTAALALWQHPGGSVEWALALALLGGEQVMLRLALAAAVGMLEPSLRPAMVGGLLSAGLLAHHAPATLKHLVGARSLAWVETGALGLSMALAFIFTLSPTVPFTGLLALLRPSLSSSIVALVLHGLATFAAHRLARRSALRVFSVLVAVVSVGVASVVLPPTFSLPLVLCVSGVVMGFPALFGLALALLVLDPVRTFELGELVVQPHAWWLVCTAAASALVLRVPRVLARVEWLLRSLGRDGVPSLERVMWWSSATLVGVLALAAPELQAALFLPAAMLACTPRRSEHGTALGLLVVLSFLVLPLPVAGVAFSLASVVLALAARFTTHPLTRLWHVCAGVLALFGVTLAGVDFGAWQVPLAWASLGVTAWLALPKQFSALSWGLTAAVLHVLLAFVGVRLSTGAPQALILPWWALSLSVLALVRHLRSGERSVQVFSVLALGEVLLGLALLSSSHVLEAVVSVLVAVVVVGLAWRRIVEADDRGSAWVGQGALLVGALAVRVLGTGSMPGLTEAWLLLAAAAVLAGLAGFLAREGRGRSAKALRLGAWLFPSLGVLFVPWAHSTPSALWLGGVSLLGAWLSRATHRRGGALLTAGALNAALLLGALGAGLTQWHLFLVPFGLTLLALGHLFRAEVSPAVLIQVRAWGMGLIYAAMAFKPLTATSAGALVLCVAVCLLGVAIGAVWRIRSYVLLGSGVVVTTVVATLVRSGLAEPRLGAVFLSLLGLAVVAVMVFVTTRRDELRARVEAMQRVMATWSP